MIGSNLVNTIREYYSGIASGNSSAVTTDILSRIQTDLKSDSKGTKTDAIPQLIFMHLVGCDTTWADFDILDIMSTENNYSAKRISYTAAGFMWNVNSPVVLLAPNRVQRDLTSANPYTVSCALSALSSFLTPAIAEHCAADVIALISSSKPAIRAKAITLFYHICTVYPECTKSGFLQLRAAIEDGSQSVVLAVLTVFAELCQYNPRTFMPLIPKFHKMLEQSYNPWMQIRLIRLLRLLCDVEPRLPRKLIQPFSNIIDSTSSVNLLFECIRSIVEIPIKDHNLLSNATQRVEAFVWSSDPNQRYVALQLFMKLIKVQPKLVSEHREIITECFNSPEDNIRLSALDLIASLASVKTLDSVVGRIYEQILAARKSSYKNQLVHKIVEICSDNDYELVTDFEWYVSVLMDITLESGATCFSFLAEQFLDLATRVPSIRQRLVQEMVQILETPEFCDKDSLLLVAAYIIGEHAGDGSPFEGILQPMIANDSARVQACCLASSFKLFLKAEGESRDHILELFALKLPLFAQSCYSDIQERAGTLIGLLPLMDEKTTQAMRANLDDGDDAEEEEFEPITRPPILDEPMDFFIETQADIDYFNPRPERKSKSKSKKPKGKKKHHKKKSGPRYPDGLAGEAMSARRSREFDDSDSESDSGKHRRRGPVKRPEKHGRTQLIGQNNSLQARAMEFYCDSAQPRILEIDIELTNNTKRELDVDIELPATANVRGVYLPPVENIEPKGTRMVTITIDCVPLASPQFAKIIFVPRNSAEVLEARLRLMPSVFLEPVDPIMLPSSEEEATQAKGSTIRCDARPRDILQGFVNVLRGSVVQKEDPNERKIVAQTSSGMPVVGSIRIEGGIVELSIKTKDATLTASLLREAEMRVRGMCKE